MIYLWSESAVVSARGIFVKHERGNFCMKSSVPHLKPVFRTVFVLSLVFMQLKSCGCGRVSRVRVDFYG